MKCELNPGEHGTLWKKIRGIFQFGELSEVVGLSLLIFQRESKMEGRGLTVVQGSESALGRVGR